MKILRSAKRAAKFTFIEMPLSMLGWRQIKSNHNYIHDVWHTLSNPHCPECGRGVMHLPHDAEPDDADNTLYGWECSAGCGFRVFAPRAPDTIMEIIAARSELRSKQRLAFLDDPTRMKLIRSHLRKSRGFWIAAALAFAWSMYLTAAGAPVMTVISSFSLCLPFTIYATRWSYRAWQVQTGTLFVQGAFQRFVHDFLWAKGG